MSNLKRISLIQFVIAFNEMKAFHENGNDPLPEMGNTSKIQYILDYPFMSVFGKTVYWGFYKKAACYFYMFAKGHIFGNGNKRSGVLAVTLFYKINNRKSVLSNQEMYNLAKLIANSNSSEKEKTITHIASVLKRHKA